MTTDENPPVLPGQTHLCHWCESAQPCRDCVWEDEEDQS
jgi:hypothetical protein